MADAGADPGNAARLWVTLWRQLATTDRRRLSVAGGVMLASSGLTAVLPILIGQLVDTALAKGSASAGGVAGPLAAVGGLFIAAQLLQVVRRQLVENVGTRFERDSRVRTYRHLMRLELEHLRRGRIGGIHSRANRSIEGAARLVKLGAMDLLPAVTLAAAALVVAFLRNPTVAAAMVLVVPTGFLLVRWQVNSQAGVRLAVRDHKESIDAQVVEMLPALDVIRTTGADHHIEANVGAACGRLQQTEMRHHRAMSLFDAAKAINEVAWLLVSLGVAVSLAGSGQITPGEVTTYVLLYAGVTAPLRELHRIVDEAAESAQQTRDLFGLLDEPEDPSFREPACERVPCAAVGSHPILSVSDVRFGYRGQPAKILEGVDLTLAPGERGGTLSGGQRQRICLARAMIRTPPLLLLDEPTSALDATTQSAVQRAIDGLPDVAMLIVAHRLSTLRWMDRILVMEGGRIVQEGSYAELAQRGGSIAGALARETEHAA